MGRGDCGCGKGLKPYAKLFRRAITQDDILRLLEIKIKRISKYDSFRADEMIKGFEEDIKEVEGFLVAAYALRNSLFQGTEEEIRKRA